MANHRLTVNTARRRVTEWKISNADQLEAQRDDLIALDNSFEAHIKARTAYALEQGDDTMINLIGTWARVARVLRDLEERYGNS